MSFKQVIYFGADGASGYANAAKGYMYDLLQRGIDVYFEPISNSSQKDSTEFSSFFAKNLKKLPFFGRSDKLKDAEVVLHISPDRWASIIAKYKDLFGERKIVGRTVWDFDPLSENWVKAINESIVNVVSVPSQWNKDVFIQSGVKKEIIVEPHIIPDIAYKKHDLIELIGTTKIFSPVTIDYKKLDHRIKILNVSTMATRKNLALLIQNYLTEFEFSDETLLLLKVTDSRKNVENADVLVKECIINRIKNADESFAYAPIILCTDTFSFDQMQSLYDVSDIYVNTSQGEGFSIPCYTMMSKQKYVVTPLHGGIKDYLTGYVNLYEVDYCVVNVGSSDNTHKLETKLWIDLSTKGIQIYSDDFKNSLKAAYHDTIRNQIYLEPFNAAQPRTELIENGELFPIYFKSGWYNDNLVQGVWNNGNAELVVGGDVSKLELVVETLRSTPINVKINGHVYQYSLDRGIYTIKCFGKQAKNIGLETNTVDGHFVGKSGEDVYGIKLIDVYVNGIHNKTSKLEIHSHNFLPDVLNESEYVSKKTNVVTTAKNGKRGDVIIKFTSNSDVYKYPKKINLDTQHSFNSHRSGWNYVLQELQILSTEEGVYCDGFVECNFGSYKNTAIDHNTIPYKKNWIGFVHTPPNTPHWYDTTSIIDIVKDPYFQESLQKCKGLFTLSEYHAKVLRQYITNIPIESLYHPTEIPDTQFDFESFIANQNKKLISVGSKFRRLNSIYTVNPKGYNKVRLLPDDGCRDNIVTVENIEALITNQTITNQQRKSVETYDVLSNQEYDDLLSKNLVYLDLYDCSANNTIIECIARATPLFINRLPAVVEYLGESYPLYIDSQYDLENKITDYELIRRAHLYLRSIRYKIEIGYFLENLVNSKIYKNL